MQCIACWTRSVAWSYTLRSGEQVRSEGKGGWRPWSGGGMVANQGAILDDTSGCNFLFGALFHPLMVE